MTRPDPLRGADPGAFSLDRPTGEEAPPRAVFLRVLREFVLPRWPNLAIAACGVIVTAATAGALPFLLQRVGDDIFVAKDTTLLWIIPAVMIVLIAIRAVADWVTTVAESSFATKIVADLRLRMFDTIAAADLAWIQGRHSGRFVSTFFNDAPIVDRAVARVLIWEAVNGLGLALAILYGGWQGIYGDVTLGHFMGFMTAALLALGPLKALANTQAQLSEGLLAAERVLAVIDYASHVTEVRHAKPPRVSAGAISFRNVDFTYDAGGPVLSNFNLEIGAGQKVALVGQSGAGKSTVINLILRFFDPVSGSILIDGQDLRQATLAGVRAAAALLTQEPVLFDDTVAANIAYGSEGASEAEIAAAAAAAHMFILGLPEGYETRVGEAGNRLSGGERQRIAFARAILRNTPILLLDEPTSALDAESEAKIQLAMGRLLEGRTVVMIAHRLATVMKADLICFMEGGRVVESGTHAELLARQGKYARMVQSQFLSNEPKLAVAGG